MHAVMFYIFATLSVICAVAMVTRRDAVTSVFWLIACFLNVAGIFATLTAHFLAVLQVLIYAGAIMVFFLFVTMFLGDSSRIKVSRGR
ncbi:MAG TPA: NADH-quinone oxidoreductase subunit J, partial [Candidatus Krumholzibacteria bacterium]|nr:NADH-quinone oxidoreductase subunit J [Candidatus Krumholzibacteria bacterium]